MTFHPWLRSDFLLRQLGSLQLLSMHKMTPACLLTVPQLLLVTPGHSCLLVANVEILQSVKLSQEQLNQELLHAVLDAF